MHATGDQLSLIMALERHKRVHLRSAFNSAGCLFDEIQRPYIEFWGRTLHYMKMSYEGVM